MQERDQGPPGLTQVPLVYKLDFFDEPENEVESDGGTGTNGDDFWNNDYHRV